MTLTDLLEEFNVVIDTHEGLSELRSLILGLAVRGKLVPQDANDEPASELLKKIETEKQRLYEEGEIRKPKKAYKIIEEDIPFQLPKSWVWSNLNEAGIINPRNSISDEKEASFISMSSISEEYFGEHDSETKLWKEIKSGYTHFAENDVGLAKITPCFQNGKSAIFSDLKNGIGAGTTELYIFRSVIDGLIPKYVYSFIRTPDFVRHGVEGMTGTAGQQRVPKSYFENRPFPLPPTNEQHRIVAKIELLFAEVDELEAQLEDQNKLDEKLQRAVNAEVQQAPDADASRFAWNIISSNFETLYHTPESIDNLKKNILNEAVRGRLVPQDPNDDPASELIQKIEPSRLKYFETGPHREPPKRIEVQKNEIDFNLPFGWKATRFSSIINVINGRAYKRAELLDKGVPVLRVGNLFTSNSWYYSDLELEEHKYIDSGDLIYAWSASFGPFIWDGEKVIYHYHIWKLEFYDPELISKRYMYYFLEEKTAEIKASGHGISMAHMTKGKMEKLVIPLPPVEEQHRIVQRIEELFAICDAYKAQLEQREQLNERLVKGLVQKVLEGV